MSDAITKLPAVVTGMRGRFRLNPVQQAVAPYIKHKAPMIVCSHTSTGKTVIAQMMSRRHLRRDRKVVYVGITKALAEQKHGEWTNPNHMWCDYNMVVITGDHSDDPTLQQRLKAAAIVIATPEALLSRLWKSQAAKNQWLQDIGILIVDEVHLCGAEQRGAALEMAVVEMQRAVPHVQLLGLSATLKNSEDFELWWENVTGATPIVVSSDWRPVPIETHYYECNYSQGEIQSVLKSIIGKDEYSGDQMLIACWNKARQKAWANEFTKLGYSVGIHNADMSYQERSSAVHQFVSRMSQLLFGTSGVIAGMNMPAKHCIVTCVELGDGTEIPAMDITQALGRAGRQGFDKIGIRHVIVPNNRLDYHRRRIEEGEPVMSQMADPRVAATHFLGSVYCGNASTLDEAVEWIKRTLYYVQRPLHLQTDEEMEKHIKSIAESMLDIGMLRKADYLEGEHVLSSKGKIAAQMLLDPYHLADLVKNFRRLDNWQNIPLIEYAKSFGACEEFKCRFSAKWNRFLDPDEPALLSMGMDSIVAVTCIYEKMRGNNIPDEWISRNSRIIKDQGRWLSALSRVVNETKAFSSLNMRDVVACSGLYAAGCGQSRDWSNNRGHPSLDDMREQLAVFTNSEVVKLASIGIYSLREARKKYGLVSAANAMSLTRMSELGISIPAGRNVPKLHAPTGIGKKLKKLSRKFTRGGTL